MFKLIQIIFGVVILIAGNSLFTTEKNIFEARTSNSFLDYRYQGKAELNRFDLQQERYGEIREGDAVLIFVMEDFLPETQVKYEN